MKKESLRNVRSMRETTTRSSIPGGRLDQVTKTNELDKSEDELRELEEMENPGKKARALRKDKHRHRRLLASYRRSRERILKSRKKLAKQINKNKALMAQRKRLQQEHWEKEKTGNSEVSTGDQNPSTKNPGRSAEVESHENELKLNY